jgi:pyruvate dehydrogenase E1 component alpha subunit
VVKFQSELALAFANKYVAPAGGPMNIAIAMYGDGAANQGQIWEAANMASLWKLPMAFVIENNKYGMGTSTNRSSSNNKYYTMGNHIPGIKINGMDVLAVRDGMKFVREFVSTGNGPIYVEMDTYRYHGHSMSDPGTTYSTREEVGDVRQTRDPIEHVKKLLTDHNLLTADEIKTIEKDIRSEVSDALTRAKAAGPPPVEWTWSDIYSDENGKNAPPEIVRLPDRLKSVKA